MSFAMSPGYPNNRHRPGLMCQTRSTVLANELYRAFTNDFSSGMTNRSSEL